jgi:hypothetical protein
MLSILLLVAMLIATTHPGQAKPNKKVKQTSIIGPDGWPARPGYCISNLPREPYERNIVNDPLECTTKLSLDENHFVSVIRVGRNLFYCSYFALAGCETLAGGKLEAVTFENPDYEPPIQPAMTLQFLSAGICVPTLPPKNVLYRPGFQVFNTAFTIAQCRDLCVVQPEKYKYFSVLQASDSTGACFCYSGW